MTKDLTSCRPTVNFSRAIPSNGIVLVLVISVALILIAFFWVRTAFEGFRLVHRETATSLAVC